MDSFEIIILKELFIVRWPKAHHIEIPPSPALGTVKLIARKKTHYEWWTEKKCIVCPYLFRVEKIFHGR